MCHVLRLTLLAGLLLAAIVAMRLLFRLRPPTPATAPLGSIALGFPQSAGLVTGLAAAAVAATAGALGRGVLLAAPLFALFVVLGTLAAQLRATSLTGSVRVADVGHRRIRDYVPVGLSRMVVAGAAVLTVMLVFTTALGSADDLGRAGRALTRRCNETTTGTHGPWAGVFYSLPLAIVVLIGIAAGLFTLHRVVRRPRPSNPHDVRTSDDALRRAHARVVVAALGVMITVPLIGVSVVTAVGLLGVNCGPPFWTTTGIALLALVPVWAWLLGSCALAVLPRLPRVRSAADYG